MWIVLGSVALILVIIVASAVVAARHNAAEAYRRAHTVTEPPPSSAPQTPASTAAPSPSYTPTPTHSASTSGSASSTHSQAKENKPSYHYKGKSAKSSKLYNVVFAAGSKSCSGIPLYEPPIPDSRLQAYAQKIVDCLVKVNKAPLAQQGLKLTTPTVRTYHTDITTPCGFLRLRDYPAWYCSQNSTIYLNATTDDTNYGYYSADLGYFYILSHEFGHHLQNVGGVMGDYAKQRADAGPQRKLELSRRLELQATCFSGVFLNATYTSLKLSKTDYDQYTWFLKNYGDERTGTKDHGTGANNVYWLSRGYSGEWSSYGDCNTWTAPASRVS